MQAIVYTRQSQDRRDEGLAIERQEQDGCDLAERRGWTVIEVIRDNDVSASGKVKRPGFDRLIDMIERQEANAVIAWDLTRLTRNSRDTLRLVETGEAAGLTVALVRGSDMDLATPSGRMTANILATVARAEIEVKSDRQKRAARQAAEAGKRIGGRRPFGYEPNGIDIRETEAAALRSVYEGLLAGISLRGAVTSLNAAGFTTSQRRTAEGHKGEPSPWRSDALRTTLLNPRYAGLRGLYHRPAKGRGYWEILGKAEWPGIVTEETWRAVKDILENPSRRTAGAIVVGLLTSIAFCGYPDCTATVHRGGTAPRLGGYGTYRCRESTRHISRKAEPIDRYVEDVVVERLSRDDAVELLIDHERPDVEQLRTRVMELRRRRGSLVRLVADGTFTEDQARAAATDLDRQLAAAEADLTDAGRADVLRELVEAIDVRAVWESYSRDRQRAVIDTMMTITLLPPGRGRRAFDPSTVRIEPKR